MGRRKERRIAAMSAAGRRVKLDLFAEPSGDLGGSSTQEEVGGDGDSKSHAELPDSPSSSGKQPQNPLLLLEQYSDEELDRDLNEVQNDPTTEDASIGKDEQSKAAAAKKVGAAEANNGIDSIEEEEELLIDNTSAASESPSEKPQKESMGGMDSSDLQKQTNKMKESTNSAALDEHLVVVGDVNSGWKMVLHEESNQYYYWNVMTGETSWDVPDVLVQQTVQMSAEEAIRDTAVKTDAVMGTYQSSTTLCTTEDDFTTRELSVKVNSETSGSVDSGTKMDGCISDTIKVKEGDREANQDNGTSLLDGHSIESNSATNPSLQLIEHCESLLERLNSVKGLNCYLEGQDLKSKCSLEIEIRLADIKALSSHESSLLPFWLHCEAQLKRLEASIDCFIQQVNPDSQGGFEAALELPEGTSDDIGVGSRETKALVATMKSHVGETTEKLILEAHNDDAATMESYSGAHPGKDLSKKSEITVTEKESELNPGPALQSVDDVDMDVDMEVEDTSPVMSPHTGASGAHYHVSVEPLDVQNTLSNQEPKVPGQVSVPSDKEWIPPPPPDDEPFPPLPPDDEPFPPPPPDDLPETSYPLSNFSSVQAVSYSGEYALAYPGPTLEYYVQTNPEVSGSALYTHTEGGQVALTHVPHYYEAGPNIYPVEPASYYGLQNGTLNPLPLMHSLAESSGAKSESASEVTGAAESLDSPEAGSAVAPTEVPEARHSPATSMANVAPISPISSTSDATASAASAAAAAAAAAALKSQPKVSRTKKRTVAVVSTLRSNKKVSSLVDKWKAAKEELHEEVEEPEDAYEILEKKRKREIEQWRAKQIASGEAKDNANFQPLGGDWRERVKRKRAEKMEETKPISPEVSADRNKQPDLIELSKSLPTGWQAYWDDSSKKVYYGNLLTSATTWTIPTD